jgi:hypothetical protein
MSAVAIREADFQATIVETARTLGWLIYHTHDSRRSSPGFPDLVLVRPPAGRLRRAEGGARQARVEQQARLSGLREQDSRLSARTAGDTAARLSPAAEGGGYAGP